MLAENLTSVFVLIQSVCVDGVRVSASIVAISCTTDSVYSQRKLIEEV